MALNKTYYEDGKIKTVESVNKKGVPKWKKIYNKSNELTGRLDYGPNGKLSKENYFNKNSRIISESVSSYHPSLLVNHKYDGENHLKQVIHYTGETLDYSIIKEYTNGNLSLKGYQNSGELPVLESVNNENIKINTDNNLEVNAVDKVQQDLFDEESLKSSEAYYEQQYKNRLETERQEKEYQEMLAKEQRREEGERKAKEKLEQEKIKEQKNANINQEKKRRTGAYKDGTLIGATEESNLTSSNWKAISKETPVENVVEEVIENTPQIETALPELKVPDDAINEAKLNKDLDNLNSEYSNARVNIDSEHSEALKMNQEIDKPKIKEAKERLRADKKEARKEKKQRKQISKKERRANKKDIRNTKKSIKLVNREERKEASEALKKETEITNLDKQVKEKYYNSRQLELEETFSDTETLEKINRDAVWNQRETDVDYFDDWEQRKEEHAVKIENEKDIPDSIKEYEKRKKQYEKRKKQYVHDNPEAAAELEVKRAELEAKREKKKALKEGVEETGEDVAKNLKKSTMRNFGHVMNLGFGVMDYKDSREAGNSVGKSVVKAGAEFAKGELLGGWYMAAMAAKAVPTIAVSAIEGVNKMSRSMNSMQGRQVFGDSQFMDTPQLATMRQSGMELAKMSQYNLQQSMMGNEAEYMHRL